MYQQLSRKFFLQEAKDIGDEFLALEKFVNLNYLVYSSSRAPSRLRNKRPATGPLACSTYCKEDSLAHAVWH